jgi:branched-chain amino acid aminotransferase/4-amino-4-deoxychorismate lyase
VIDPTDRGLTLGDGLFETLLWEGGLRHAPAHLARLAAGCATLGLPAPDAARAVRLMEEAVTQAGLSAARAAVRLTLTAGRGGRGLDRPAELDCQLFATVAPAPKPATPARLILSGVRRNEGSPASRLKTLAYLDNVLARGEARRRGVDEAVMLNNAGHLACAAAANLFWVDEAGALNTPSLGCGALAGITRARVLAAAEVREVAAPPEALTNARAVFLSNSLIGLRPVAAVEGRALVPWDGLPALERALA